MSIYAEDIDQAIAFLPGLFRFNEGEPFTQSVLALTPDCLFIYNDHAPDEVKGEDWSYNVKQRINLNDIELATNETIVSKRPLKESTSRLILNLKGEEPKVITFFYYNIKTSFANNFMMGLKRYNIKTKNIKTKLSY